VGLQRGPGTAPIGGDGDCPGGNPRTRWRPTDMEAGAGWRCGADGRKGIRTQSISVRYAETGEGSWGARGRASGHGRGGWQSRRRGAARDAAGSGNSGGGTGDHGRCVDHALTLYEPELSFCLAGSDDPKDCEM